MTDHSELNQRVVVGFDLRKLPIRGITAQVPSSIDFARHPGFAASIDIDVWPSWIDGEDPDRWMFGHSNSLNLLGLPDFWRVDESTRKLAVPVAFDLPINHLQEICRGDHVTQIGLSALESLSGWQLLGFDVVDKYVGYSAICSPHFGSARTALLSKTTELTSCGVFPTYQAAAASLQEIASIDAFHEHSPFSPCGIWVKL